MTEVYVSRVLCVLVCFHGTSVLYIWIMTLYLSEWLNINKFVVVCSCARVLGQVYIALAELIHHVLAIMNLLHTIIDYGEMRIKDIYIYNARAYDTHTNTHTQHAAQDGTSDARTNST